MAKSELAPIVAVADALDEFSEDEHFAYSNTGDSRHLGARDAFDLAVTRIRSALREIEATS